MNPTYSPHETVSTSGDDAIFRRIAIRVVPLLFISYLISFIDRINVGFAQAPMRETLGFGPAVYGLAAGAYAVGYCLFEVPSNLLVTKIGARRTFTRIMVIWGVVSASTMFVNAPWQFYAVRFLLGLFEAGFFPGIVLYLTFWFPSTMRARMLSWFFVGTALAGVFGGIASGLILQHLDTLGGLRGWQWMFLLEGLPSTALGVIVWLYLPDNPGAASWLTDPEKEQVHNRLNADRDDRKTTDSHSFRHALRNVHVYLFIAVYFLLACGSFAIPYWLPTLILEAGVTSPLQIGLYSAIPYTIGAIGIVLISAHSDRSAERRWHYTLCSILGAVALLAATAPFGNLFTMLALMSLTIALVYGSIPVFWALPPKYLGRGGSLAGGIALISSVGNLGGFFSPYIIGAVKQSTGSLQIGIGVMAVLLGTSGLLLITTTMRAPKTDAIHSTAN